MTWTISKAGFLVGGTNMRFGPGGGLGFWMDVICGAGDNGRDVLLRLLPDRAEEIERLALARAERALAGPETL